jgi:selenophosphate synthase
MLETRDDATYWFRHLAEANALRDVNAMGARPLTAVTTIRSVEASLVGPLMVEALA